MSSRHHRVAWLGLAAFIPSLLACTDRTLSDPGRTPDIFTGTTGPTIVNRNVDLLFVIDDSSSMRLSQANLERNFPTFMTTLKNAPQGLPNVHVAVISSNISCTRIAVLNQGRMVFEGDLASAKRRECSGPAEWTLPVRCAAAATPVGGLHRGYLRR